MRVAKHLIETNSPDDSEWKVIIVDKYKTYYEMNKKAQIRNSITGRILKPYYFCPNTRISLRMEVGNCILSVKRIYASLFVTIPDKYKDIDVLDLEVYFHNGIKDDFSEGNVRWWYLRDDSVKNKKDLPYYIYSPIDEVQKVIALLKKGEHSIDEIAKMTGMANSQIKSIRQKAYKDLTKNVNIPRPKGSGYTKKDIICICELLSMGDISLDDIAFVTGIHKSTVYGVYRRYNHKNISKDYVWGNIISKDGYRENLLKESEIREICELLQKGKMKVKKIAKKYGMFVGTINRIKSGKIYKEISQDYDFTKKEGD